MVLLPMYDLTLSPKLIGQREKEKHTCDILWRKDFGFDCWVYCACHLL